MIHRKTWPAFLAGAVCAVVVSASPLLAKATKSDSQSIAVSPDGHIWYTTFVDGNRLNDLSPDGCRKSYLVGNVSSMFGNVAANGVGAVAVVDGLRQRAYVVKAGVLRSFHLPERTDTSLLHIVGSSGGIFWLVGSHGPLIEFSAKGISLQNRLPDDVATAVASVRSGFVFTGKRGIYYFGDRGAFRRAPFPNAAKTTGLALDPVGNAWAVQRHPAPFVFALRYVAADGATRVFLLPNGSDDPPMVSLPNGNVVVAGDGWVRQYAPQGLVWRTRVAAGGTITSLAFDPQMDAVLYVTSGDRTAAVDKEGHILPLPSADSNGHACADKALRRQNSLPDPLHH